MLVLSRRLNEKIVLPGLGVTIAVVAVRGHAVRLGIQAPPQVPVAREEVRDHARDPAPQARWVC
jgi:carbon storage regulator